MAYQPGAELTARWEAEQLAAIEAEAAEDAAALTRQAQAMRRELRACAVGSLKEYMQASGYWATLWRQFDVFVLTLFCGAGHVLPADAERHARAFGVPDGVPWVYDDSKQQATCKWEVEA